MLQANPKGKKSVFASDKLSMPTLVTNQCCLILHPSLPSVAYQMLCLDQEPESQQHKQEVKCFHVQSKLQKGESKGRRENFLKSYG